ncbi:hypothetical protein R6Q59_016790 [Mikania micrantha]
MNPKTSSFVASSMIISALLVLAFCGLGFCRLERSLMYLGGIRDIGKAAQNSVQLESLARFAVEEHNRKEQTSFLKFGRLVKVKEQVVAGVIYYLTFEAYDGGNTKVYEAKVWVKPWMNFKQLQEFKLSSVR